MESEGILWVPEVDDSSDVAESVQGRKILRIVLEIEVGGTKNHSGRLKEAYLAAVGAAGEAVRAVLLNGSAVGLKSHMTYEYRHLEGSDVAWTVVNGNGE